MFTIIPSDNSIWNRDELIDYLVQHQNEKIQLSLNGEGNNCKAIGLYRLLDSFEFESVDIITANAIEHHDKYNIVYQSTLMYAVVRDSVDTQYHVWNKNKIFCAYYGRPVWHRIGLASYLKSRYNEESMVNLRGDYNDEDSRRLFEVTEFFRWAPEHIKDFAKIADQLPLMLEKNDGYTPGGLPGTTDFTNQLLEFYPNIFVDIVAETFISGDSFYPTEKTFRPMLLKKPFIVMGAANNLIYLKQMGFKTFSDFWSEDYDGLSRKARYQKIIELIDFIASRSKDELYDMYQRMQPILDHNYDLLISKSYKRAITLVT
jgi:hypothetical protein